MKNTRFAFLFSFFISFLSVSARNLLPDKHETDSMVISDDQKAKRKHDELTKKANQYKASITDTTYLQTTMEMSHAAIDVMNDQGYNDDYLYNQVVYIAALNRARKFLSVKNGKLICSLSSAKEIYVREDLYNFILGVFNLWNELLESGNYRITTDEEGLLTIIYKNDERK